MLQALLQGVNPQLVQFLDIRIRRERVLEDALNQIVGRPHELKKPLRVTFVSQGVDEEGLDLGGSRRSSSSSSPAKFSTRFAWLP